MTTATKATKAERQSEAAEAWQRAVDTAVRGEQLTAVQVAEVAAAAEELGRPMEQFAADVLAANPQPKQQPVVEVLPVLESLQQRMTAAEQRRQDNASRHLIAMVRKHAAGEVLTDAELTGLSEALETLDKPMGLFDSWAAIVRQERSTAESLAKCRTEKQIRADIEAATAELNRVTTELNRKIADNRCELNTRLSVSSNLRTIRSQYAFLFQN